MSWNVRNMYDMDAAIAEFYDLHENGTADVEMVRALLAGRGPLRVLEVFCGTGRILLPLALDGHQVVGLDQSRVLLGRCREKLAALPEETQQRVTLIEGDAVAGQWPGGFDAVILAGNWAYELATPQEQEACIATAAKVLKPGGYLLSDSDHQEGELDESWQVINEPHPAWPTGTLPDGTRLEAWSQTVWFDAEKRLAHFRRGITVTLADGSVHTSEPQLQQKHPISADELRGYFAKYGFEILWTSGGNGRPYSPDASRARFWTRNI